MTQSDIEAALNAAFTQCEAAACPLSDRQKQILRQQLYTADLRSSGGEGGENPLEPLTFEERQALLDFVRDHEQQNQPWKIALLNDWLAGRSSGPVQFIRERYGVQWLEQVKPAHLASYEGLQDEAVLKLKVGDRIEVTNGLWEWVQESGPCSREWFPCTVISIREPADGNPSQTGHPSVDASGGKLSNTTSDRSASCIIRFDSGAEYEIQGLYDWNRPNWRWLQD